MLGVVQRLLRLVKIQILRCAPLRNNHDISLLLNFLCIQTIQEAHALSVSRHGITGNDFYNIFMFVQYDI